MVRGVPKVSRQIRLDPDVEADVQSVADIEDRSFSSCANWLLREAASRYLLEKRRAESDR